MIPILSTIVLMASWYGDYFHGRTAANGTTFNMYAATAAHKSLPFGTQLRVCYKACEVVTITDRGPFIPGRGLDLSKGTAYRIGMLDAGVAPVKVYRLN